MAGRRNVVVIHGGPAPLTGVRFSRSESDVVSPLIDLHGAQLRWPDGTVGTIRQEYWPHVDRLLGDGHATYVMPIDVIKPGCLPVSGAIRFSDDYLAGLHGETDVEKSGEARGAVQSKLVALRLDNGFTLTLLCS